MTEIDSVDPFATWVAGSHRPIPLLPRGTALFESMPARAIVFEALGPAIGNGAIVVRGPRAVGVILIRDGDLIEKHAFEGAERLDGEDARRRIESWQDATVSADRFERVVVSIAPALLRGGVEYEGLRLGWTDWGELLADLRSRDGLYAVELDTPAGRGVTLIGAGRQIATYTDAHPELGSPTLLDPLVATRRGTIRVRHQDGGEALAEMGGVDWATPTVATSEAPDGPGVPAVSQAIPEELDATEAAGPDPGGPDDEASRIDAPGGAPPDAGVSAADQADAPGSDARSSEPEVPEGVSPRDVAQASAGTPGDQGLAASKVPPTAAARGAASAPAAATRDGTPVPTATGARRPPARRDFWGDLWSRRRGRQVALVASCMLILAGLGLTAPSLIDQAKVQQAVAARGGNDLNAVNSWLSGSASADPSSSQAGVVAATGSTCGGAASESDAYALVEFTGLPQYGYVGVAVNGNWTQLDDRSMVHWYGSPAPGGDGNVIMAFHREPDFQYIDQLTTGETVTIEDRSCQTYVYTITKHWELAPSDVNQLVPTGGQQLTLITCTPWWQDYDRLVWRADLTSVNGAPVGSSP